MSGPSPAPATGRRRFGLHSLRIDTTAWRGSREYRILLSGTLVSGLGNQLTVVALPFQLFAITHSSFLVGLLGVAQLGPLIAIGLVGGAVADRMDRRRLLLVSQVALAAISLALVAGAALGPPPIAVLYLLAGLSAGFGAIERPSRAAMLPAVVGPDKLRSALSLSFGLTQLVMVVGPAVGGLLIAAVGVTGAYVADTATFVVMALAALALTPKPPPPDTVHEPLGTAIVSGLRFARGSQPLFGGFVVDILAMTFGMPRALFPALALDTYQAGPSGVGLLYASVSAGAAVVALTAGWVTKARRLGKIVVGSIAVWGIAIALAGLTSSIVVAMGLLALAGGADSVSALCRNTILFTVTPDELRGRMASVYFLVVTGGPRIGDLESGAVAAATSVEASVVSGGLLCLAGLVVFVKAFPNFVRYEEGPPLPRAGPG